MSEIEAAGVNEGVLRDVDFSRKARPVMPALDYLPDQDMAMISLPLYLKESGASAGVMSAPKAYTVVATGGRRLCIPTVDLPMRIAGMPVFIDPQSRWPEESLRLFLEGTYVCPSPAELFSRIVTLFDKYLDLPLVETRLLAAWSLGTYFYPLWPAFGLLSVNGTFGSGKSRVLTLLAQIAFQPISLANCTAAALFRCQRVTALIDEAELIGSSSQRELKLILQASYRQEGGEVIRCAGRGRLAKWPVYGPKAIAAIKPLDDVLSSRAIVVTMHRSMDPAKTALRLDASSEDWAGLRAAVQATVLTTWRDLIGTPVESEGLASRRREVMLPLLQIARWADPTGEIAMDLLSYAIRSSTLAIQAVAMTSDETKVITALAGAPNLNTEQWWTAEEIKRVVVERFPDLTSMSLATLGLCAAKHRLFAEKRHTVRGKIMRLDGQRIASLAAQAGR